MPKQHTRAADGVFQRSKGGPYYIRVRHRGYDRIRSTEKRNRREAAGVAEEIAAQVREEIDAEVARKRIDASDAGKLLTYSVDDIIAASGRGVTESHKKSVEQSWRSIFKIVDQNTSVLDIDEAWLEDYQAKRRKSGVRGQTIRLEYQAIKRALKLARRRGVIPGLPEFPTCRKDPKDPQRKGTRRSRQEIEAFLAALSPEARDESMFIALTGIRDKEAKRVTYSMFVESEEGDPVPAYLHLPDSATKSRRDRVVPVSEAALAIVQRRSLTARDELVFSRESFSKQRREVSKRLKLPKTVTHRDLRHTFASLAMRSTGDPTAVLRVLGHSDLKVTEVYLSSTLQEIGAAGLTVAKHLEFTKQLPAKRRLQDVGRDELAELVKELPNTRVAERFGVTEAAVRKHRKKLGV